MLGGKQVLEVLNAIEAEYAPDVTLFCTPPMLATDDMMAFARHMDCALLVGGAELSTK